MKPLFSFIRDYLDLADYLQISDKKLLFLANAPSYRKYDTFSIPKRSGGIRTIEAPTTSLKVVQKKLNALLKPYYSPLPCVHGFAEGKSIVTGSYSHLSRSKKRFGFRKEGRYYFSLDIQDFFPSITSRRIYGLLVGRRLRATPDVAFLISKLCIGASGLAQGSPVSPLISNMICLGLDRKIMTFAKKNELFYSRYADDITLSTSNKKRFLEVFFSSNKLVVPSELKKAIVEHNGHDSFQINPKKVRSLMPQDRQMITGIVVNEKMNVPREYYRNLRSCLHTWSTEGRDAASAKYYHIDAPEEIDIIKLEERVYGKLEFYKNVVSCNKLRCTPLEKLGSMFNRVCEDRLFPIHQPEDSLFIIRVNIPGKADFAEGTAFYLKGVGIVTSRHTFDDLSVEGAYLHISLTSIISMKDYEMNVKVEPRDDRKKYDCVKLDIDEDKLRQTFPFVQPLTLSESVFDRNPVKDEEIVTAFDVELISDFDQSIREYGCTEVFAPCKKSSQSNQYGRMSQIIGKEFYKGMSGGPVLDQEGRVLGIVKSGIERGSQSRNGRSAFLILDGLDKIPYGVSPKE